MQLTDTHPVKLMAFTTLLVAGVIFALYLFNVDEQLLQLLRWVDSQGAWSAILFVSIMALVVVLLLPGFLFTTGAGFVFGIVNGTLYVVLGTTVGAVVAFLLSRYLMGARARNYVRDHAKLNFLAEELKTRGFLIVLFTRLIPFFPGKLSNYFFGLTSVSLRSYAGATLVGLIPFSLHNVYLGSLAASLMTLDSQGFGRTPLQWSIYLLGFVSVVIAVVYLNKLARRRLDSLTIEPSQDTTHVR